MIPAPPSGLFRVLGLMSGTSLDGIDVALLETDGAAVVRRGPSATFAYAADQRALLRRALADAAPLTERSHRPGCLAEAEAALTLWHAKAVHSFCQQHGLNDSEDSKIHLLGFHGQTVLHRPERHLTVQLGDGAALARRMGIPVAWDLRAADVAAGGQGAPLVPAYHAALAAGLPLRPVAFVNIGGVANVTFVGAGGDLLAFDTGPGNALLDDWMLRHTGAARDEGGALALSGRADRRWLARALADPFFAMAPPKSLDRNHFAGLPLPPLSAADGAATLAAFTVAAIAAARRHFPAEPQQWIICGGGRHNHALMQGLAAALPGVIAAEQAGLNGDAMEAEAWAYLAVRAARSLPLTFPGTTGVPRPLSGGVLSQT